MIDTEKGGQAHPLGGSPGSAGLPKWWKVRPAGPHGDASPQGSEWATLTLLCSAGRSQQGDPSRTPAASHPPGHLPCPPQINLQNSASNGTVRPNAQGSKGQFTRFSPTVSCSRPSCRRSGVCACPPSQTTPRHPCAADGGGCAPRRWAGRAGDPGLSQPFITCLSQTGPRFSSPVSFSVLANIIARTFKMVVSSLFFFSVTAHYKRKTQRVVFCNHSPFPDIAGPLNSERPTS